MRLMNPQTAFVLGTMGATIFAQAPDTPQRSRQEAPNIPPANETVPERMLPDDPDAARSIQPFRPEPKIEDIRSKRTATAAGIRSFDVEDK